MIMVLNIFILDVGHMGPLRGWYPIIGKPSGGSPGETALLGFILEGVIL